MLSNLYVYPTVNRTRANELIGSHELVNVINALKESVSKKIKFDIAAIDIPEAVMYHFQLRMKK